MRHLIFCIALGALLLGPADSRAATSYKGTWGFNLRVVNTTCKGVTVGTAKSLDLVFDQNKKVITAAPAVTDPSLVGSQDAYEGYTTKGGILMSLTESCPVVPMPTCMPNSESFNFLSSSKKSTKVLWLSVLRGVTGQHDCTTVYSGTARKKKTSKK